MYLNKLGVLNIRNYQVYFIDRRVVGIKNEEENPKRKNIVGNKMLKQIILLNSFKEKPT